jgi:endonuclease/exonuclease/phosphatase family metal-dependent hydrolase
MIVFKVMTWNLENLAAFGHTDGPDTPTEYEQKINGLAGTILENDADVLAVQEVLDPNAFHDLVSRLGGCYPYTLLATPDARGIRVGFLSKLPFEDQEEISTFPEGSLDCVPGIDGHGNSIDVIKLGRSALHVQVCPLLGFPIHLITIHLKSKLPSYPSRTGKARFSTNDEDERARVAGYGLLRRTAEAVALRVRVNELLEARPDEALILCGDCNDVANAATTQILQGPSGSEIPDIDEKTHHDHAFDTPDTGDAVRLFNLAARIHHENRYSRINNGNKELIDHIFVSEELLPGHPRRLPVVDSLVNNLESVTDDPRQRLGKPCSDHAPVIATFQMN